MLKGKKVNVFDGGDVKQTNEEKHLQNCEVVFKPTKTSSIFKKIGKCE